MYLARVIGNMISSDKYEDAFGGRKMLMVQRLGLDQKDVGYATMAIDYVGAGVGDIVLVGAAPGLAATVFNLPKAPIRELVMAIVDWVEMNGAYQPFGNSVPKDEPAPACEEHPVPLKSVSSPPAKSKKKDSLGHIRKQP